MPGTIALTRDQAALLAQVFHDLASAIADFRIQQAPVLSDEQQFRLQNLQNQFTALSNQFIAMSMFAEEEDLDATLEAIANSTKAAKAAIRAIGIVDKVLQIATAAAVLGESIATMNPSAIESGIKGLAGAIAGGKGDQDTTANGDN